MFNNMNLDEITLVLDIGRQANDDLSRWYEMTFNNDDDHPVMTANLTVRFDRFDEACAALRVDPVEARNEAFVRIQSPHFGSNGRRAHEVAWVKVRKGDSSIEITLYHLEHDNRAVVVCDDQHGVDGEVFISRSDAAHAFNGSVARHQRVE